MTRSLRSLNDKCEVTAPSARISTIERSEAEQVIERRRRESFVMLKLSLQFARFDGVAAHRAALPRARVLRWLRAALGGDVQSAEFTVRVVDAEEGRGLNHAFRGRNHATNVLTFGYDPAPDLLADLVLCAPVAAREAAALGKPLAEHYAHLLIHGALHAQGWDHETSDADADAMEAEEAAILARLGFANPYRLNDK
jgi:probable rRNA maturation factor